MSQFGFSRSPDSDKNLTNPSFNLVVLVPDNARGEGTQTLTYTGTGVGVTGSQTLAFKGDWTGAIGGTLDAFLGNSVQGGPAAPQSGFLARETNQGITGVTGFDVYLFDYGTVNFGHRDPTFVPGGSFNGSLIAGTEIYSFIDGPGAGQRQDATAPSSTIIESPNFVPDGGTTLMLLGGALVGLATLRPKFRA